MIGCQVDAQWALADLLASFAELEPAVEPVVLLFADPPALVQLAAWRVDALVMWSPGRGGGSAARSLVAATEETLAVVREDDPLRSATAFPVTTALHRTVWLFPRDSGAEAWDAMVDHLGGPPDVRIVGEGHGTSSQDAMIAAVREHGGVSFATRRHLVRNAWNGVVGLPLRPALVMPVYITWHGTPGRALQRLIGCLQPDVQPPPAS